MDERRRFLGSRCRGERTTGRASSRREPIPLETALSWLASLRPAAVLALLRDPDFAFVSMTAFAGFRVNSTGYANPLVRRRLAQEILQNDKFADKIRALAEEAKPPLSPQPARTPKTHPSRLSPYWRAGGGLAQPRGRTAGRARPAAPGAGRRAAGPRPTQEARTRGRRRPAPGGRRARRPGAPRPAAGPAHRPPGAAGAKMQAEQAALLKALAPGQSLHASAARLAPTVLRHSPDSRTEADLWREAVAAPAAQGQGRHGAGAGPGRAAGRPRRADGAGHRRAGPTSARARRGRRPGWRAACWRPAWPAAKRRPRPKRWSACCCCCRRPRTPGARRANGCLTCEPAAARPSRRGGRPWNVCADLSPDAHDWLAAEVAAAAPALAEELMPAPGALGPDDPLPLPGGWTARRLLRRRQRLRRSAAWRRRGRRWPRCRRPTRRPTSGSGRR